MKYLDRRIAAMESRQPQISRKWHSILWDAGQTWAQVLKAHNDGEDIAPGDNVILHMVVDADDGRAVPDPVMDREHPIATAWLAERRLA